MDALVTGTILVLYLAKPFIRLYPTFISGSKFTSSSASQGCIANVDLFKTNPPISGNVAGDVCDKSGMLYYSGI